MQPLLDDYGPELACLGLLILERAGTESEVRHLFYGCYGGFRMVPKRQVHVPRRKGVARPRGDALRLEMENGALLLIFSDGKSYHDYVERLGD